MAHRSPVPFAYFYGGEDPNNTARMLNNLHGGNAPLGKLPLSLQPLIGGAGNTIN